MLSGRRSPCRQRGRLSGILADAIDDHKQRKAEDADRRAMELRREHEKSHERKLTQQDHRGRTGKDSGMYTIMTKPALPSYDEAIGVRPRALSAAPAIDTLCQKNDRVNGQHGQYLMPPDMAGPTMKRPGSAQCYHDQPMSFDPDPTSPDSSYLRDPGLNDSFLRNPYARGPTLFGPREPTYLTPRQERRTMGMDGGCAIINARRKYSGSNRGTYDESYNGNRGVGDQQSLLGSVVGAAVQAGINSHHQKRVRAASMEPPRTERMM